MTVHQILAHPDYPRFAREVTECGRMIVPDVFPWRFMGKSDAELATADLCFDHGTPIGAEYREALIRVVRHHEGLLLEHWQWWQDLRRGDGAPNAKVCVGEPDACVALLPEPTKAVGEQMALFR